ncbi:hypothetical protein ACN47E_006287 [Coniothyrium glycines]
MSEQGSDTSKPFRVVVVGAGIVGLTLAHALQLAKIDHVVLEKHREIVSLRGAALIVWPGMARTLDQFGFLNKIIETTTRITKECNRWPDGSIANGHGNMQELSKIFDIPDILFDRQTLVQHLYENLPDRSKIQVNKRVESVEHTEEGVRVRLDDGSVEEGSIVIGADGVHSKVRDFMWDYASQTDAASIVEADRNTFSAEYGGLFGVSNHKDEFHMGPSESNVIYGHGTTKLLFSQPGTVYWAVMFPIGKSQPPKRLPSGEEDMEKVAAQLADISMTETIKFGDLWSNRRRAGLINLEEGVAKKWHAGRIVLVGDSASKMTADLGMGANLAVESAVTLCNILHREVKSNPNRHFSVDELDKLFAEYQKARFDRCSAYVDLSGKVTRMRAWNTYFGRFMISYVAPLINHSRMMDFAKSLAQAPKLDYVPVQTINEDAEGWKLADKTKKDDAVSSTWLAYVVLTSTVGVSLAYAASTGLLPTLL